MSRARDGAGVNRFAAQVGRKRGNLSEKASRVGVIVRLGERPTPSRKHSRGCPYGMGVRRGRSY